MKNKGILLIAVFGLMGVHAAYSQAQVGIGLKAGINLASINTGANITQNYDSRTGYHFGAYALFKLTKIAIQPEIVFSKQGTSSTFNGQNLSANYDYITVPVLLKLYLIGGLNLQAGVQFGFLGNSAGDVYNTASNTVTSGTSYAQFMQETDFSVPVGVGFDLPLGLNVTARYNIGVKDINEHTGTLNPALVSALGTSAAKNQVFQFSVGFRIFKLGK